MINNRIEINPKIMFGKPVIKGTRITVEAITRKLANGLAVEDIITDHPQLTPDDIDAAVAFNANHHANGK
jgi:uncharacterized protein (DUF433 family)